MADYDASILSSGNLGQLAMAANQQRLNQQQDFLKNLATAGSAIKTGLTNEDVNEALKNNVDPATGQINQQGVLADLYKSQPQQAMALSQQFQAQKLANNKAGLENMKVAAETGKLNAETGKIGYDANKLDADTQAVQLKNHSDGLGQLTQLIQAVDPKSPNAQMQMNKVLAFAKKQQLPGTELFEGQPVTDALKNQALGMSIDAKSQVDQMIQKQNADTQAYKAQADDRNAQTTNMVTIRGQDNMANIENTKNQFQANKDYREQANKDRDYVFKETEANAKNQIENVEKIRPIDQQITTLTNSIRDIKNFNGNIAEVRDKINALQNDAILPRESLIIQSNIPGTKAYEAKALYNQTLSGNNFNTISAAKQAGGGLSGATSDRDMAASSAFKGLVDTNPFSLDQKTLNDRLTVLQDGNQAVINEFGNNIKLNNNYKNKVNKGTAPLQIESARGNSAVNNTPVFTSSNNTTLTQAQINEMNKISGMR